MTPRWTHMIWALALATAVGCGSDTSRKVHEKWPRVDPKPVAAAAVTAAALMTLANPDSAGRPEGDDEERKLKDGKPGQQMPASMLDRLDDHEGAATKESGVPCPESKEGEHAARGTPRGVQLVPLAPRENPDPAREDCPEE